ncbi:MAG: PspC domain-containing protein [Treponema sp.]|nr:PspC domain-containing protein [Treponema sp.]
MTKRLAKSRKQKMLFGVCGGIAEYFSIDVTLVRIILIVLAFISGTGILAYLICAIVMPYADSCDDVDNLKSANIHDDEDAHHRNNAHASNGKAHSDSEFDSYFKKQ